MENALTGIDEIMNYTRKSASELMNLRRDFGFPMVKKGGIYCISIDALLKWLKSWDIHIQDPLKISYSEIEALYLRRVQAKEPGKMLSGDINAICEKLKISPATFLDLFKNESCPVRKIPGTNQYRVDSKNWRDYYDLVCR